MLDKGNEAKNCKECLFLLYYHFDMDYSSEPFKCNG